VRPTRRDLLRLALPRQADAYAALLAEEHAAIHLYGVVGPRLPKELREYARAAYDDHRRHRDLLVELVRAAGGTPAPPLLSYAVPAGAPQAVAESIEDSLAVRWHAAVRQPGERARVAAALADEAAHLARLRYARRHSVADAVSAFPGR